MTGVQTCALPIFKQKDWNEYVIIADGNHLTHKINGHTTVEVIDESPDALTKGIMAIQVHAGGPMKVQVKDIWLKTLDHEHEEKSEKSK